MLDSEGDIFACHIFPSALTGDKHKMDKEQTSDTVSSTPENRIYCSNASGNTKSLENYLSANIGFVQATSTGMVLPQFPCLVVNYKNRPGPLVTPNLVPSRPVAHSLDIQRETPKLTQTADSDGRVYDSDTMCKILLQRI